MNRTKEERVDEARRRLLRAGAAGVPAILSVVVVQGTQAAPSCGPVTMGMNAAMATNMGAMGNSAMQ